MEEYLGFSNLNRRSIQYVKTRSRPRMVSSNDHEPPARSTVCCKEQEQRNWPYRTNPHPWRSAWCYLQAFESLAWLGAWLWLGGCSSFKLLIWHWIDIAISLSPKTFKSFFPLDDDLKSPITTFTIICDFPLLLRSIYLIPVGRAFKRLPLY